MEEKILNTAAEMFLDYGFKSVTMDDIAERLGMSKKTIYNHYPTKTKLVHAAATHIFQTIQKGINEIRSIENDPLEENFEIKRFVMHRLKDEKSSPQYQLQKYYPKIYEELTSKQFHLMETCVRENLERGIKIGCYRKDIPVDFISKIYFKAMQNIKDPDLFPPEDYSKLYLMEQLMEYHLRAICTEKGIQKLEELIINHE
ncbi:TetR/AcrR family transcriptional regulator [Gramella jeungdoensis]|uniref:TetR/AcrR family transcriptional regulator n=1 Tax=Gramella jeungdoensis TaxID=708091 RepID=A0ABT0Z3V0_9FLAO|nr:TetR/AcrR family transcriptional regulator [Gramella jeungdoensis]MCM8569429.1 TetR/AcrR family transcriptional regulator [Gramella jeungdoensis]